jgi:hypothetical protein
MAQAAIKIIVLRVPADLADELKADADRRKRSVNKHLVRIISKHLQTNEQPKAVNDR